MVPFATVAEGAVAVDDDDNPVAEGVVFELDAAATVTVAAAVAATANAAVVAAAAAATEEEDGQGLPPTWRGEALAGTGEACDDDTPPPAPPVALPLPPSSWTWLRNTFRAIESPLGRLYMDLAGTELSVVAEIGLRASDEG